MRMGTLKYAILGLLNRNAKKSYKYAELCCRTQKNALRVSNKRSEVSHYTYSKEDKRRIDSQFNSQIEQVQ